MMETTPASSTADHALPMAAWPSPSVGRNRAFRELYHRCFRLVWMVVRAGGVPPAHCEDVVQEVWLQVHRLVDRLRPDASARAWLVSIARRRVAHYHRSQRRRERKETAFGHEAETRGEAPAGRVEALSTVDRVLHGMSEDQRLTFVLVHAYGLTGEEVASAVGDSVNTVYSRLRLARRHLGRAAAAARLEEHRVAQAARTYAQPPRGAQSRMRVLLAFKLGWPALGAVVPGSMLGVGTVGAAAAAGIVALRLAIAPAAPTGDDGSASATATTVEVSDATAEPEPEPAPMALPDPQPTLAAAALASGPSTPAEASARAAEPRATVRASKAGREPRSSTLAAETELLKRAKRALDEGSAARALSLLDEHAQRFPRAVLADVRHGVRVRALCALGRGAQARQEAARMATARPGSVVALGVEDVCAAPDDGDAPS